MATYRFRVTPPDGFPYETNGDGITWGFAKDNVARREGVDSSRVVATSQGSAPIDDGWRPSGDGLVGMIGILGFLLIGGIVITFWKWILIGGIIVGILWWWCKD